MSATPSRSLRASLSTLAILALVVAPERRADAANPTTAECAAANQKSVKLRASKMFRQARDQANTCAATSCSAQVRNACKKRVTELSAIMPTMVFITKDIDGHALTAVKVSMDGEQIADHIDGTPLEVDPGQHTFTFEAAGLPSVDQSFMISQAQKERHEAITFSAPPPPPPVAVASATTSTPGADTGADAGASGSRGYMKPLAFVLGGVGVAGIVAGGVTGALAISKWHASESACGSTSNCPNHSEALSDHNTASTLSTVSTITFIVGGASLAAATLFFLMAPGKSGSSNAQGEWLQVSPSVGPYGGGLTLEGVF
jgi:hypothetical protein